MAVGPHELLTLTAEDEIAVGRLELLIDEKLQANYEPGGQVQINLSLLGDVVKHRITFKMKKELFSRYERVGWTIKLDGSGVSETMIFAGPKVKTEAEKDAIIPDVPVDQILEKMKEKAISGDAGHKPPAFKPVTRDDTPYGSRGKLASK